MSPTAQYLVETTITLVAVVGVSILVLVAARRLGLGTQPARGPLALVARLPLDQRRTIYLVRAGSQLLVVGGGEGGLVKLAELPPESVPKDTAVAASKPASFREILGLLREQDKQMDDLPPPQDSEEEAS